MTWEHIETAPRDGRLVMIYVSALGLAVPAMWGPGWKNTEQEPWRDCWVLLHKEHHIGCRPGVLGLPPDAHLMPELWAEPPERFAQFRLHRDALTPSYQ